MRATIECLGTSSHSAHCCGSQIQQLSRAFPGDPLYFPSIRVYSGLYITSEDLE